MASLAGGAGIGRLGDFPSQDELDKMDKQRLQGLWESLLGECDGREGAIASRAFTIGWLMAKEGN